VGGKREIRVLWIW